MERPPVFGDNAGDESLTVGSILLGDDRRLADSWPRADRGLDFGEFDAEAPNFHLAVSAAQQLEDSSLRHRARSPVAYIRDPGPPCGSGTNRSAV